MNNMLSHQTNRNAKCYKLLGNVSDEEVFQNRKASVDASRLLIIAHIGTHLNSIFYPANVRTIEYYGKFHY